MRISNKTIKPLSKFISGDDGIAPYRKGPELVDFFNECGWDDVYGQGFPSRWVYVAENIEEANGTDQLRHVLEEFVDVHRYGGQEKYVEKLISVLNTFLKPDGYGLVLYGNKYKITDLHGNLVQPEAVTLIGHDFVTEQIRKCNEKIQSQDYNGAITNARSLLEAVFIDIIEKSEGVEVKNDGNLVALWTRCKKVLKMHFTKDELPDSIYQILAGLDGVINGLAGISNNAGDRHANKFKTQKHHAKLAVNAAMTLSDFITEVNFLRQIPKKNP